MLMLKNMQTKLTALLGSVRFWIITLTAVVAILQSKVDVGFYDLAHILDIVQVWLGAVVGVGTLDSLAQKLSGVTKKK